MVIKQLNKVRNRSLLAVRKRKDGLRKWLKESRKNVISIRANIRNNLINKVNLGLMMLLLMDSMNLKFMNQDKIVKSYHI